ncbi:MAG: hypothetical protein JOZ81_17545 [Chloroflexi bacterium]|nr:hypothetical protein [Chloroflexota bacterium]
MSRGALVIYADRTKAANPTGMIVFQYNPETVTRTIQQQGTDYDWQRNAGDTEHTTLPLESLTLSIELDLADQLEWSVDSAIKYGLHPSLNALELLVYPSSEALRNELELERGGKAAVAPGAIPMVILVWGQNRVLPVRLTSLSITEEAFDPTLNPIRANVELSLRSLTVRELRDAGSPWKQLVVDQVTQKERLAVYDSNSDAALAAQRIATTAQPPGGQN